jgi:hypothetical protein
MLVFEKIRALVGLIQQNAKKVYTAKPQIYPGYNLARLLQQSFKNSTNFQLRKYLIEKMLD